MKRCWIVALFLFPVLLFAITAGPNFPTAATGNTNVVGGGTVAWLNPTNIEADDGAFASCLPGIAVTDDLIGTGFGFAVAVTDTINGIQLEIAASTPTTNNIEKFNNVRLLKAGVAAGADKATAATLVNALTIFSFGGPADLWGTTWTPADVNNANFGGLANLASSTGGGAGTLQIDYFRITVTSTAAVVIVPRRLHKFGSFSPTKKAILIQHTQTRTFKIGI